MRNAFDHLTAPQVVLVLGSLAAALAAAYWIPETKWRVIPWESIIALIAASGAGVGATLMRPRPEAARASTRASEPTRTPRDGSASIALLGDLIGLAACVSAAVWLVLRAGL